MVDSQGEDEDEKSITIELYADNLFMICLYKKIKIPECCLDRL